MKNKRNAFTLVELLAVIVILAIILVIAVPKVMSIIKDAKKGTLETTAKMIASTAEKKKLENTILESDETIECKSVTKLNDTDYPVCKIDFDGNTAKVTITGGGQFEGLYVCNGTKTLATATEESCTLVTLTVDPDGGTETTYNAKYEAGSTVTLTEPTKEGFAFVSWVIETGEGAEVNGNTLKMGTTATKVKATWGVIPGTFGDDTWETIVAAVKQASDNGTPYPYNVGDTKTITLTGDNVEYTIRVANKTKCSELEQTVTSKTACGFVLEFADIITKMQMRDTLTNEGGWPATNVRTYLNNEDAPTSLYNLLPTVLRDKIINTYVISSYGYKDTSGNLDDDNFGYDDKIYLLSTHELWGSNAGYDAAATNTITRQLDYYEEKKVTISANNSYATKKYQGNVSAWWLRSAGSNSSSDFYIVGSSGGNVNNGASNSYGVAPAFRLGE